VLPPCFFAVAVATVCLPAVVVSLGHQTRPLFTADPAKQDGDSAEPELSGNSRQIRLYITDQQEVVSLDLEEYLVGVVMAEMPASFELEALKAQAVAARTYLLHQLRSTGGSGCDRGSLLADICSDSVHCQAWVNPEKKVALWPADRRDDYLRRIRKAVHQTAGEVIVYQGKLIEAVYHSTCGGKTEYSSSIWSGVPVSYLQSVACAYCSHSPYYQKELLLPSETLNTIFRQNPALFAGPGGESLLKAVSLTPGGRVGLLRFNDLLIEGEEVCRLLDLPSLLKPSVSFFQKTRLVAGVIPAVCRNGSRKIRGLSKTKRMLTIYAFALILAAGIFYGQLSRLRLAEPPHAEPPFDWSAYLPIDTNRRSRIRITGREKPKRSEPRGINRP